MKKWHMKLTAHLDYDFEIEVGDDMTAAEVEVYAAEEYPYSEEDVWREWAECEVEPVEGE